MIDDQQFGDADVRERAVGVDNFGSLSLTADELAPQAFLTRFGTSRAGQLLRTALPRSA